MALTLYDYEFAICPTKVRLLLHEKAIAWQRVRVNLGAFEHKHPQYLRLNSAGVVPTVVVDRGTLTESHVIARYLDAAFDGSSLVPDDPFSAAQMDLRMVDIEKAHQSYGVLLYDQVFVPHWRRLGMARLEPLWEACDSRLIEQLRRMVQDWVPASRVSAARQQLRELYSRADASLSVNRWLAGHTLSLADFCLLPYVASPLGAAKALQSGLLHLAAWLATMQRRSSFEQAILMHPPSAEIEESIQLAPEGGQWHR